MSRLLASIVVLTLVLGVTQTPTWAQEESDAPPAAAETPKPEVEDGDAMTPEPADEAAAEEEPAAAEAKSDPKAEITDQIDEISRSVDQSETAKETSAGILTPIYQLAEAMEFPAFHWFAFALMFSGVVGYALQLVIGKLVVFAHLGFSLREILSDLLGLAISVVGLVLTTQAAAQNSTFTQSPSAVLSASGFGLVIGLVIYFWGQAEEVAAVKGRAAVAREKAKEKK